MSWGSALIFPPLLCRLWMCECVRLSWGSRRRLLQTCRRRIRVWTHTGNIVFLIFFIFLQIAANSSAQYKSVEHIQVLYFFFFLQIAAKSSAQDNECGHIQALQFLSSIVFLVFLVFPRTCRLRRGSAHSSTSVHFHFSLCTFFSYQFWLYRHVQTAVGLLVRLKVKLSKTKSNLSGD